MKKLFLGIAAVGLMGSNLLVAADENKPELVSIDSILLMQKSKEGQKLLAKIQKEVEDFQEKVKQAQKEVVDFQDTITKQAKVLSKEALVEKSEKLADMKKNAERQLSDKEEALKNDIQKRQFALREKQMTVANEVFENKKWGLMIDRNTPGVLFVSNAIDRTEEILTAVDQKYDTEIAQSVVRATSKTEKTVKNS